MAVISRAFAHAVAAIGEIEWLTQLVLFCAAGLFVGLLSLTSGLDLSAGFF